MKTKALLAAFAELLFIPIMSIADTEIVDGIEWNYSVYGDSTTITARSYDGVSAYIPSISIGVTGVVSIPSSLGGKAVTSIGNGAFDGCTSMTGIIIPDTVTSIGRHAFAGCESLQAIIIPEGVTALPAYTFRGCSALKEIVLPDSLGSISHSAGYETFQSCYAISKITVSSLTKWMEVFAPAFPIPSGERELYVGQTKVSGILSIPTNISVIHDGVFARVTALSSVIIPDGVTSVGSHAFFGCSHLSRVMIPDSVTSIGNFAFAGCSELELVTIGSGVTRIEQGAFSDCSKLTTITIPDGVTFIGDSTFSGCSELTSVTIPVSVKSIGQYAFSSCYGLTSFAIPNGVTSIGRGAFSNCSGLSSITIPNGVTSIEDQTFFGCSRLSSITIPDGVTTIGNNAFDNCTNLTNLLIPKSVISIGSYAFRECRRLVHLVFPISLKSIGENSFNASGLNVVEFKGGVPTGLINSRLNLNSINLRVVYSEEFGAEWNRYLTSIRGTIMDYAHAEPAVVDILSVVMRENDPTIMDVVYKVVSSNDTVNVRALAFEDGERSFAKVVRPETFVDGTGANLGDGVAANVEHTVSWRVSADWQTDLAKASFEILVSDQGQLPMELVTIPAAAGQEAMTVNVRAPTPTLIFDALLWHFADHAPDLSVVDGELRQGDSVLASRDAPVNTIAPIAYVYDKMGFDVLLGDDLDYVRTATRWPLRTTGFNGSYWTYGRHYVNGQDVTEWYAQSGNLAYIQYAVKREAGE